MNKQNLQSIKAIAAGFVFVVIFSLITDFVLEATGLMKQPFDLNSDGFIVFVILYRSLYGTTGSYLTARLAPVKPMKHSMAGGLIGFALSVAGAITMWNKPPHWYPIALVITALPCAWLGAKIFLNGQQHNSDTAVE